MKNNKKENKVAKVIKAFVTRNSKKTDPNGSYTGVPEDKNEVPTQDADDL